MVYTASSLLAPRLHIALLAFSCYILRVNADFNATVLNDNPKEIIYSPLTAWSQETNLVPSDTEHMVMTSIEPNSTVTLLFTGIAVYFWSLLQDGQEAQVAMSLDGGDVDYTDIPSRPTTQSGLVWSREELENMSHTLVARVVFGRVNVDNFQYTSLENSNDAATTRISTTPTPFLPGVLLSESEAAHELKLRHIAIAISSCGALAGIIACCTFRCIFLRRRRVYRNLDAPEGETPGLIRQKKSPSSRQPAPSSSRRSIDPHPRENPTRDAAAAPKDLSDASTQHHTRDHSTGSRSWLTQTATIVESDRATIHSKIPKPKPFGNPDKALPMHRSATTHPAVGDASLYSSPSAISQGFLATEFTDLFDRRPTILDSRFDIQSVTSTTYPPSSSVIPHSLRHSSDPFNDPSASAWAESSDIETYSTSQSNRGSVISNFSESSSRPNGFPSRELTSLFTAADAISEGMSVDSSRYPPSSSVFPRSLRN